MSKPDWEQFADGQVAIPYEDATRAMLDVMREERDVLLDACNFVLRHLDNLTDVWGQDGITKTVQDRLRAAIAKAEGEL